MNCEEAKILSVAHILGDLDPGSEQCRQLESHLAFCPVCAEEYESSKWAIGFIEEHKAEFAVAFEAIDREKAAEQEEIELSWKRIEARLDELEVQERKEKQAKRWTYRGKPTKKAQKLQVLEKRLGMAVSAYRGHQIL